MRKGNLFIVFTPLQLFVAQQIVRQEHLTDCVLVEGWRSLFAKTYDMMRMEDLWTCRYEWEDFSRWIGDRLNSLAEVRKMRRGYKRLLTICEKHSVGTIYMGELLNQSCRFTAIAFSHLGYKVVFFEEGTSHYINRPCTERHTRKEHLKQWLLDALYFKPLYGIRFAKWHCAPNRPYEGDLPIDKRFSIIPYYNEPYDARLKVEPMFSPQLKQYVEENLPTGSERRVMLLTDPMAELLTEDYMYLYFNLIEETLLQLDKDVALYIKYHPRDPQASRERVEAIAKKQGITYRVLSEEVNIPVEYYLQSCKFEAIYVFNASTYFYNGYIFPKHTFIRLLPELYNRAVTAGVAQEKLKWLKGFVDGIQISVREQA